MDFHDPYVVYTTNNPTQATLIQNLLQDNGITCVLDGYDQPLGAGFIANEIRIVVETGHADVATRLIQEHEPK